METLEIPDEHRERIERLRAELDDEHGGSYATVETEHALAYLLDLAEAVDDPDRTADPARLSDIGDERTDGSEATAESAETATGDESASFDREAVRERLTERNRRHGDPDDAAQMDLYSIATAFDVTGRSEMTKPELIEAILDRAAAFSADPFDAIGADVGIDDAASATDEVADDPTTGDADDGSATEEGDAPEMGRDGAETDGDDGVDEETGDAEPEPENPGETADDATDTETGDVETDDTGTTQLNAMMSLLDTHDDKWREGDGDARYKVTLPDGSVETARTKDDVRALLFKNY